ncbi:MAG TPA: HAD family hydrolase [Gemmatimonadaceae bacterium]|nr:HAD family hydrolase [Gemmatimonadaceae bacterium]
MHRALICDLDNTLFPAHAISASALSPLRAAVLSSNRGPKALPSQLVERALEEARWRPFDAVAEELHLPAPVRAAWAAAYTTLQLSGPLMPYPDVAVLAQLALPRFLVTSGFRRFQESKVATLGIGHLFDALYIDALDEPEREGKAGIFRRIVRERDLVPADVFVVGDSAESELRIGRELGMVTVQVLRDHVEPCAWATHRIHGLHELVALIAARISPHSG